MKLTIIIQHLGSTIENLGKVVNTEYDNSSDDVVSETAICLDSTCNFTGIGLLSVYSLDFW